MQETSKHFTITAKYAKVYQPVKFIIQVDTKEAFEAIENICKKAYSLKSDKMTTFEGEVLHQMLQQLNYNIY